MTLPRWVVEELDQIRLLYSNNAYGGEPPQLPPGEGGVTFFGPDYFNSYLGNYLGL